jgi:colanic acid biosynthesis glycosyl transferase WcaI
MHILIISQNYYPEPVNLWSELSESLQDIGHNVTVLTGFPNFPSGKLYPGYRIKLWQKEIINGVSVVRVPLYPYHGRSALKRSLNYLSFMLASCVLGAWGMRRPDVIYAIQPPTTCLPAWFFSLIWQIPFIYDLQDMWPETLYATGMMNNTKMLRMVTKYCDWIYKRADAIRVISPGFRSNLIKKGVIESKIHLISNWVNTGFYKPKEQDSALAQRFRLIDRINIVYAGTIGPAQGMDTVLDAALLLKDLSEVQFVLVGDGIDLERLKKLSKSYRLENLKFLGRQPMKLMPSLYMLSDMLLVHLRDDPLFRITIPHKTLTYLASGKPVLAAVEGDVADVIKAVGAGLTCRPGDPAALAEAVRNYCNMSSESRAVMGDNGRKVACDYYAKDHLIEQVDQMLSGVVRMSRSS